MSGILIWGFVLSNVILTLPCRPPALALSYMTSFRSLLCVLPFKIQVYLRAPCTVSWLSLGNYPFSYSSESFVIEELESH